MGRCTLTVDGDRFLLDFHDDRAFIILDRWREVRSDTWAEVTIRASVGGGPIVHLHTSRWNLCSMSHRETLARLLRKKDQDAETRSWDSILELATGIALERRRAGDPIIALPDVTAEGAVRYRIHGWIPEDGCTVLYGDGGVGKSTLALAAACAVQGGRPFLGLEVRSGPVLYVDYETTAPVQAQRLRRLARGLGYTTPPPVMYKCLSTPIVDVALDLQAQCARTGVAMVCVDSLGYAVGDARAEKDLTIDTFRALNALGRPVLVLSHVTKAGPSDKPYGSVYIWNSARSVVEVKKHQDPGGGALYVGLYHRKANDGPLSHPISAEIRFSPEEITLTRREIADTPELADHLPLGTRALEFLKRGHQPADVIAEALEISEAAARKVLGRLHLHGRVVKVQTAPGKPTWWGVASPREEG